MRIFLLLMNRKSRNPKTTPKDSLNKAVQSNKKALSNNMRKVLKSR